MKTIKARHKLIPAIVMLIVAAITMSTASYAWFTMSSKVEVDGIQLNVVAPTNLLIRETGEDVAFSNRVSVATNPSTGKLNHASSIDGISMFTVSNPNEGIDVDGYIIDAEASIVKTTTMVADTADGYYFDYEFDLVNTGNENVFVGLRNLEINGTTTSPAGGSIEEAVRFAILNHDKNTNLATDGSKNIFAKTDGRSADAYKSVTVGDVQPTVAGIEYLPADKADGFIEVLGGGVADKDSPQEVSNLVVRIWIEGQDAACITENAGTQFDISFDLVVLPYQP